MTKARKKYRSWFSSEDWKWIQRRFPVVCVDVLPIRFSGRARNSVEAVGLILRETPHQGRRWCLVGGRLLYGESLSNAVRRQIRETLGPRAHPVLKRGQQPLYVAQYSPSGKKPFALDPRQHAVGLTYVVEIKGVPQASGEAIRYEWFNLDLLPSPKQFGFDQGRIVRVCVKLFQG